jgi:hypothetical protein
LDITDEALYPTFGRKLLHRSPETEVVRMWGYEERVVIERDPVIRIVRYLGDTWVLLVRSHIQSLVGNHCADLQNQRW